MPSRLLPAPPPGLVELPHRSRRPAAPRVLFYSHDTYGLGHLRRTLALAGGVEARWPAASQLVVAGAAPFGSWAVPAGADWIKLPAVVKRGAESYEPRTLDLPFDAVSALRSDILLSAARHFRPDVLVVDHAPCGLRGEAVRTLRHLHAAGTRLVLGLRDVLDESSVVRSTWTRTGVYELLDGVYDRILVYGARDVCDVVAEYGLSRAAAAKTRFLGYLGAVSTREPAEVRRSLELRTGTLVLVTAGGGADGVTLLRTMLAGMQARRSPGFDCLVVAGPLMSDADRRELERLAEGSAYARLLPAVDDLADYVAAADAVVAMGGYNTTREILSFGTPAVIVPRVEPRQEQLIRARALAARGLVQCLHPAELGPGRLLAAVDALLVGPARPSAAVPLDGLAAFVDELEELTSASTSAGEPRPRRAAAAV